jgi:hypothetical protein
MMRRTIAAAGLLLALAACSPEPPDFSFGGRGFQPGDARLNLAYAERNLGNLGRYRGRPAEAAAAMAQFEAAVAGMRDPANGIAVSQLEAQLLVAGLRQERSAFGIPPETPPDVVAAAFAAAVPPLAAGDQAGIRAALSNRVFALGPEETLARLTNLPPLRDIESVAPAMTTSAYAGISGGQVVRRR